MTKQDIIRTPSPNFDARQPPTGQDNQIVDTVVLHYTGMKSAYAAIERLCDPKAQVSAHYLIEENGATHLLVEPSARAWHAGISYWQGRDSLNHTSIGIELVNPGHEFGYIPFREEQVRSLLYLLTELKARFSIPTSRFIGHSDIAPDRKMDPGEYFPWEQLAQSGFGVWPKSSTKNETILAKKGMVGPKVEWLNQSLSKIGYSVPVQTEFSSITETALAAFQRHWRPSAITGSLDVGTKLALQEVEEQIETDKKLIY